MTVRKVLIAEGAAQARHARVRTARRRVLRGAGPNSWSTPTHEVEHYSYCRELKKLVRRFGKAAGAARPGKLPSPPAVR